MQSVVRRWRFKVSGMVDALRASRSLRLNQIFQSTRDNSLTQLDNQAVASHFIFLKKQGKRQGTGNLPQMISVVNFWYGW